MSAADGFGVGATWDTASELTTADERAAGDRASGNAPPTGLVMDSCVTAGAVSAARGGLDSSGTGISERGCRRSDVTVLSVVDMSSLALFRAAGVLVVVTTGLCLASTPANELGTSGTTLNRNPGGLRVDASLLLGDVFGCHGPFVPGPGFESVCDGVPAEDAALSAEAIPQPTPKVTAVPIPRATASFPTRPTYPDRFTSAPAIAR
ncbi:MAG: hypothetical protein JO280_14820 [Mycobacteriaceae bacterium]|nr:hypothetical protein [Mycobacteriaceae bacterium]